MSKGMHGGLSGKARKKHDRSRAERMYAQHLIEEFFDSDEESIAPDHVAPVKPLDADSADSRYAYEFVAEAREEVAQSAEAQRFEDAINAESELNVMKSETESNSAAVEQVVAEVSPVQESAQPAVQRDQVVAAVPVGVAPKYVDILKEIAAKRLADKEEGQRKWTASVQPKLFTLAPARTARRSRVSWSGLVAGLAIGAAAGGVLLGLLSLLV